MRSLRFATTSDEKDKVAGEEDPTDANERTNSKSPLLMWLKTKWRFARGKPVEYTKGKLDMKSLTAKKREENTIWTLVRRDFTTYQWWNKVGLNEIVTAKKGMTNKEILAEVQNTNEFQRYKRYAIAFDDHVISLFGSGYYRPTRFIDKNATPVEMMARAQIWAEKKDCRSMSRNFWGC
ncbi:hypothetical protein PI124_g21288 [Phytophthora idaei]|nr:hypothetical protein PI125_g22949 [Phytophthora idaei]KAG3129155.1 hypothetical protein PI126_g21090 [Phytophthora idaei]KAG3233641.1 hypothetical protein PI124_g21288 [Phytophthora idaei]